LSSADWRALGDLRSGRLVKKYCRAAGINPDRLDGRGIGIHSLRKTILQHLIANGTPMHEVREFAGHSDIRTTDLYFTRRDDDAEKAARNIRIRVPTRQGN
jgi:integrase